MAFPRRPSAVLRYLIPAFFFVLFFFALSGPDRFPSRSLWSYNYARGEHPIDRLIQQADEEFERKLAKETKTLAEAAAAYRQRRGRHPPPDFDKWWKFATQHNAIIVEEFWDQIYHDLEPFWALNPAQIRKAAWEFEMRIHVRNGKASTESNWFWTQIWLDMLKQIEHLLPDIDIALNAMDEPRIVVPWENMTEYMIKAAETRKIVDVGSVITEFEKRPPPGEGPEKDEVLADKAWETTDKHYWKIARRGCPPDSPAQQAELITDYSKPQMAPASSLAHMRDGYVANYTLSTLFCHQPDLQALEGIFVRPLSVSATKTLFPMFGGSKLAVNNEILLPAPMYWDANSRFMGPEEDAATPWSEKIPKVVWRGVGTGGRNNETNWRAFQRHRFVAMNNATALKLATDAAFSKTSYTYPADEQVAFFPNNFDLPDYQQYPTVPRPNELPDWVASWSDIGLTDLFCAYEGFKHSCNYTGSYFKPVEGLDLAKQYHYKILPDVDGNSFSGRYLGFLRSTSLPVKATLWREWHDSRLVAWKHFVPMDNRFGDWFGIVEYFLGGKSITGNKQKDEELREKRDKNAEKIALAGREWASKVLRKEDMLIYVLRLMLEYARVCDERREVMGWVGDLLEA